MSENRIIEIMNSVKRENSDNEAQKDESKQQQIQTILPKESPKNSNENVFFSLRKMLIDKENSGVASGPQNNSGSGLQGIADQLNLTSKDFAIDVKKEVEELDKQ